MTMQGRTLEYAQAKSQFADFPNKNFPPQNEPFLYDSFYLISLYFQILFGMPVYIT